MIGLVLFMSLIGIIAYFLLRKNDYWFKKGVPQNVTSFVSGAFMKTMLRLDSFAVLHDETYKKFKGKR